MLIKITLIGIFGIFIINMIKQYKSEYVIAVTIAVAISMMFPLIELFADVKYELEKCMDEFAINSEVIKNALKLTSVAYIRKFGCDICNDFGQKIIADKIDFAARIAVVVILFPYISQTYVYIIKLL